jgi:hypothetical protein
MRADHVTYVLVHMRIAQREHRLMHTTASTHKTDVRSDTTLKNGPSALCPLAIGCGVFFTGRDAELETMRGKSGRGQ